MHKIEEKYLILNDTNQAHLSQSLAYVQYLNYDCDVINVQFKSKKLKTLSYLLDKVNLYNKNLLSFSQDPFCNKYAGIISTGSGTYYASVLLAKALHLPNLAILLPRGYRLTNFSRILAPQHDMPPDLPNITTLPINISLLEHISHHSSPQLTPPSIGIILGGNNKVYTMDAASIEKSFSQIAQLFPFHTIAITTSRRTPHNICDLAKSYPFYKKLFFPHQESNPIPYFLNHCHVVFVSEDSTLMISEAVSHGESYVGIIPLRNKNTNHKYNRFIKHLEEISAVSYLGSEFQYMNHKIDIKTLVEGIPLCASSSCCPN